MIAKKEKELDDMSEAKSSIELYCEFAKELSYRRCKLKKSDIEQLLDIMRYELIVSTCSPLLDVAYSSCRLFFSNHRMSIYKFKPTSFFFSDSYKRMEIPFFDAWWIIILLSKYLSGVSITENIDRLMPYFFGNNIPKNPNVDDLLRTLQSIDAEIQLYRKKMYSFYVSKLGDKIVELYSCGTDSVIDRRYAELISSSVTAATEKERVTILSDARKQAEEERKHIVGTAHEEAKEIIQRAVLEAENKISNARKKCAELLEDSRKQSTFAEQQLLQHGFSEVRTALLQANEMIKKLEDTVSESSTKKITTQLLELFNIIADSKESAFDMAHKNSNQDLENAAYNMDVFLDMIIEYMVEYGIKPITSAPGDKFSSKYHTIGAKNRQFDPRSAFVKVSRRTGFIWGEQVLQKEQVEI